MLQPNQDEANGELKLIIEALAARVSKLENEQSGINKAQRLVGSDVISIKAKQATTDKRVSSIEELLEGLK